MRMITRLKIAKNGYMWSVYSNRCGDSQHEVLDEGFELPDCGDWYIMNQVLTIFSIQRSANK